MVSTQSSWVTSCLSVFKAPLALTTNSPRQVMRGGSAPISKPCSGALIFRRGNPTPAFELPMDSDNRTEEAHNLHGQLVGNEVITFQSEGLFLPRATGPRGQVQGACWLHPGHQDLTE